MTRFIACSFPSLKTVALGAFVVATLAMTAACADGDPGDPDGGEPDAAPTYLTDDELVDMAFDYASGNVTEVSDADFTSAHGGAVVAIFVNDEAVSDYNTVDPVNVTGPTFAEGTMIIKQHKDGVDGINTAMTVMYKQADGYSDTGNWWWARLEVDGTRTVVGSSPGACLGCHTDVAASDYVYGLE